LTGVVNFLLAPGKKANKMFSKFLNLKPEKQQRILNAAMKEFAQKGFARASTNEIVKKAHISKGLLFHYFHNKRDLFIFLYDYVWDILMNEFFGEEDLRERDIFIRLTQFAAQKVDLIKRYPEMFNFVKAALVEDAREVKAALECRNKEKIKTSYEKSFADIDVSKFREDVDVKRAVDIITWTIQGLSAREQEKAGPQFLQELDFDKIAAELDAYLTLLRNRFYEDC
jgi:TetR/AcrR family transcriptional regulator